MSKRIEELEKEIEELNIQHGIYTGITAEECPSEECPDRTELKLLKAKLEERKLAEKEFLELIDELKYFASIEAEKEIEEYKKYLKQKITGEEK